MGTLDVSVAGQSAAGRTRTLSLPLDSFLNHKLLDKAKSLSVLTDRFQSYSQWLCQYGQIISPNWPCLSHWTGLDMVMKVMHPPAKWCKNPCRFRHHKFLA